MRASAVVQMSTGESRQAYGRQLPIDKLDKATEPGESDDEDEARSDDSDESDEPDESGDEDEGDEGDNCTCKVFALVRADGKLVITCGCDLGEMNWAPRAETREELIDQVRGKLEKYLDDRRTE
jgi:hypothetical protein